MSKLTFHTGKFSSLIRLMRREIRKDSTLSKMAQDIALVVTQGMGHLLVCKYSISEVSRRVNATTGRIRAIVPRSLARYFELVKVDEDNIWVRLLRCDGYRGRLVFTVASAWTPGCNVDLNARLRSQDENVEEDKIYNLLFNHISKTLYENRKSFSSSYFCSRMPPANSRDFKRDRLVFRIISDPIMKATFLDLFPLSSQPIKKNGLRVSRKGKPLEQWTCTDFVGYISGLIRENFDRTFISPSYGFDCVKVSNFLNKTKLEADEYKQMIDWQMGNLDIGNFVPNVGFFASFSAYNQWKSKTRFKTHLSPTRTKTDFVRSTRSELRALAAQQDKYWDVEKLSAPEVEERVNELLTQLEGKSQ